MLLHSAARRIGLIVLASLMPAVSQAQWNLSNDFSGTNNPNGVWTFGSRTLGNLSAPGLSVYTTPGSQFGWDQSWYTGTLPYVSKNVTSTTQTFSTVTYAPAQVGLHPGAAGEYSIVRWTAPNTGLYSLASTFIGIDCCVTSTDVHVLVNGTSFFSGFVNGYGASQSYSNTFALTSGDNVELVVGYGSNQNYLDDSTGLDLSINAVTATPEPATATLLATGLLAVGGLTRRRRRTR